MSEKEQVIREKVQHQGIFDFKGFYGFAHDWLKEEKEYGVVEEKYNEKVSGNTRDIKIEWLASKLLIENFNIEIKIKFDIGDLADVEVEVDSERKKMNKGKVEVEIRGTIVKDPDSKWDKSPFSRFMRDTYNKYVIPGRINNVENRIKTDVINLKEELKAFMELSARRS